MLALEYKVKKGSSHPLGATIKNNGVNFSVFSENAEGMELLLFEKFDSPQPFQVIELDPIKNRTFSFWHAFVEGLPKGTCYGYRVWGPDNVYEGHRFDRNKVLIDPYAKGNTDKLWDRIKACKPGDNVETSMRSVVIDINDYDWEDDKPLNIPTEKSIIYEMHVGGFTKSSTSNVQNPGTFEGVMEKIPYLKDLGINAVELLPICEYDDKEIIKETGDHEILKDYWGYSTLGFFAPDSNYCKNPEIGNHINEFRDMVKALHKAGIEVIMDVVFNHTNEGNHLGPIISFKGFDNLVYYYHVVNDKQYYYDYSGCGNTFNCNHPVVEKLIIECLEFWVKEMHVDGFRFDEGSILSRGEDGNPLLHPPILWNIELSETLADTKLIAEAWDAAGLYQIGGFPGYRWAEWNGLYRDDIRKFVKGDPGLTRNVATRIAGSADIYEHSRHSPLNSVNFICCHDGFTMMDLVSYNQKHNEANGENNNDGINENLSWNCGVEGETNSPEIIYLRKKLIKNYFTILMLSQGIPMFLSGDEVGRTQKGNNNAYCQDNEISWFDWNNTNTNGDILHYVKKIIQFRNNNDSLKRGSFFRGDINKDGVPDISWHGTELNKPNWEDGSSRCLAFTIGSFNENQPNIHVMMNMYWEHVKFDIPYVVGQKWKLLIDTAKASPDDFLDNGPEIVENYVLEGRSIVVLISKN